tara:strand:- start:6844 stop:7398 length:555 start_codon:yes stop_codon:yes gene_type:complete
MKAELKIFTGPMFGGKTTKLLAALERYKYQNKKVKLFKPRIDNRYSKQNVVTHTGQLHEAILVNSGIDILENAEDAQVIAVDEVFMIQYSAKALLSMFANNRTILVSSLQLSSEPKPLPEIKDLLPYATNIEICPAVCSMCDADAFYTRRKSESQRQIEVGGAEEYEPLCYEHYNKIVGIWRNR